jgi:tetratricopeptide (TPR) repeat protein
MPNHPLTAVTLLRSPGDSINLRGMILMPLPPRFGVLILPVLLLLAGCFPASRTDLQEEKDPHYLAGKSRMDNRDFDGAIEAFEKALENNPRSAAAHLELGLLHEQRRNDFATAIYHYQKHLQFRPQSNVADSVAERINSCRLQLAGTVPYAMLNRQVNSEITRLNEENNALRKQVEQLNTQLALAAANPGLSSQQPLPGQASPVHPVHPVPPAIPSQPQTAANRLGSSPLPSSTMPPRAAETFRSDSNRPARVRPHTVQARETVFSISRRYKVSPAEILAANPGLVPERLRVGQTINVPAP